MRWLIQVQYFTSHKHVHDFGHRSVDFVPRRSPAKLVSLRRRRVLVTETRVTDDPQKASGSNYVFIHYGPRRMSAGVGPLNQS